jgi:hypothetical protein
VLAFSQILDSKIELDQDMSLPEYFQSLEKKYPVKVFYLPEWFDQIKFSKQDHNSMTLNTALDNVLEGSSIRYILLYDYALIFIKDPAQALGREILLRKAKEEQKDINSFTIGNKLNIKSNKKIQVSGVIRDADSKQPMAGATVLVSALGIQLTTGADGKYSFSMPAGKQVINFQYINYEEKVVDLEAYDNGSMDIVMKEIPRLLDEVVVSDQQISNVNGQVGLTALKINELKKMPAFLGEVDIIKQIQFLPGVTSVGEVSSGFNVRGGGVDQNLILYDGIQAFNNSHVFGFFSAFSSEAIKDATFYKGGIPSEYGGRISSVLNITTKDGNYEKWGAQGGIGLISSHVTVEGPIEKNVSSVMVSVRSSYSDWLLKQFTTKYNDIKNSSVSFYDASVKLSRKLKGNDKIAFSGYISKDKFGLPNDTTFTWQNMMGSLRYDHIINERLSTNITAGYGQYGYQVNDEDPYTAYEMRYKISYPSLKIEAAYETERQKIVFGVNSLYYKIDAATLQPQSELSNVIAAKTSPQQSLENAFFISDNFDLTNKLHVDLGFRLSMFSSLGAASLRHYQSGSSPDESTVIDTVNYKSGQVVKNYFGPEPRLSIRYTLSPTSSVKFGYNRMYQYIHLISNSVAVTPIDIWQPSNYYFKPQIGDQVSLGYFKDLKDNLYELSVEGFYKEVQNLLDYKDGATIVLNPALETSLLKGIGKSYGVEFAISKTKGRLSGSLNYTYSRSFRKVQGSSDAESINHGAYYRSNYDQPNIVNVNWKYGLSRRFSFTGNFTYHTGRPVTVPTSYAVIDHIPVITFSARNEYRVPDYHRLDIALVIEGSHKRKKFWDGTWTISFYNVYARKNVYTVYYDKNPNGLQSAYQMSIVGTVLPSISYRFKI